jgi:single-stranded-DNA-specific exonuclease
VSQPENKRVWRQRGTFDPQVAPPRPMPKAVWQILQSRGICTNDEVDHWLSPALSELRNPFELDGMQKAVERLVEAYESNEKVSIYGDFDLDGSSGLSLLYDGFTRLGFENLSWYQPRRLVEGYGLHVNAVENLAESGTQVLVTVDVGISDLKAAQRAKELGVDLIITDHHLPKDELPIAYTIVNPNSGVCSSELNHLAGVGVGLYLILALRNQFSKLEIGTPKFNPKELLDLFAIGTITDAVPLIKENRVLVKHGLLELEKTKRVGLRLLLKASDLLGRSLSATDVSMSMAPKLNALSRLETSVLPADVFLEADPLKAAQMIEVVLEQNEKRKSMQAHSEASAMEAWQEKGQQGFAWIYSTDFHKGIIGLVAARLANKLGVPAFVGSVGEDGSVVGSARAPEKYSGNLVEVLNLVSENLDRFGGHRQAAGFSLSLENAEKMNQGFQKIFSICNVDEEPSETYFDAEISLGEIDPSLMSWLESFEPLGKGFPNPVFKLDGVRAADIKELRGGHRRMKLKQRGTVLQAILFSPGIEEQSWVNGDSLDLLCEPQWNYWNGNRTLQILIREGQRTK